MNGPQLVLFLGPGGVGKTSLASSYAAYQAQKGRKTLIITVDPSLRLKQLWPLQTRLEPQPLAPHLFGLILDHQAAFEAFLRPLIPSQWWPRLKHNNLYDLITGPLGSLQEFSFLDRIYHFYYSYQWEIIVIDTAPHVHGLGFLQAPRDLLELFHPRWLKILTIAGSPKIWDWFSQKWNPINLILEHLVGDEFLMHLKDFLAAATQVYPALEKRLKFLDHLWQRPENQVFLVTQPDEAKVCETQRLKQAIEKMGISHITFLINRAYPAWLWPNPLDQVNPYPQRHWLTQWWQANQHQLIETQRQLSGEKFVWIPQWHWQMAPRPEDPCWTKVWDQLP